MIKVPQYTSRDRSLLLWTMIPFSIIFNLILFGGRYFGSLKLFLLASVLTFVILAVSFVLYGAIAVSFRERFPGDSNFLRRSAVLIVIFLTMSALVVFGIYQLYGALGLGSTNNSFTWAYITTGILNIFLTFLNEGIYRFESWKENLREAEQLKLAYKQSQLIGLKSQVNPHFLFNSLNSLSGLIQEDTDKAEAFLNDMSKVYRYMLRNDEEQLVTVNTEIQFISSYFALLRARYGEAVSLRVDIQEADREKMLPPLSLQVVVENALYQNKTGKSSPLDISIVSGDESIVIRNNIQPKILTETGDQESGLDNLVKKYRLISDRPVEIHDSGSERRIVLPLLRKMEEMAL